MKLLHEEAKKDIFDLEEMNDDVKINVEEIADALRDARPLFEAEEGFYKKARVIAEKSWTLSVENQLKFIEEQVTEYDRNSSHKTILLKRVMQVMLEGNTENKIERTKSIFFHLLINRKISFLQARRSVERLLIDLDDILIDIPLAL